MATTTDNNVHKDDQTVWTEDVQLNDLGHAANQVDHERGFFETIYRQPTLFGWCFYAIYTCLLASFENQAAGMVLSIPEFRKDFGYPYGGDYVLDAAWQSAFYGGPLASTIIGTLSAGVLADKFGRKAVLGINILLSFSAIALEFVASTPGVFFAGKFLNGLFTGFIMSVAITYVGEIAPLVLRGFLTCATALMFTLGPLISAVIVERTGTYDNPWAYRAVFSAQFGFAGIALVFVCFMPESPTWYMLVHKEDRAVRSLRRLGYDDAEATSKMAQIKLTLEQSQTETEGSSYIELFQRQNLRRTIISIMPLTIQALGGVYFIASYGTYYIELAGYSTEDAFKLQVGQQGLAMFGNICSWYLVERIGRRDLTFWGQFIITIILMLCAGLAVAGTPSAIEGTVAMIMIYNWFYNVSIGATAFTLLTEVATSRLRAKTISVGISLQYTIYVIWAFTIPLMFNPDKANLGAKTAFVFGGLSVLCLVYLWFYQVETAGRSYEELDELFMKGISVREFKNYVTEAEGKGQEAKAMQS